MNAQLLGKRDHRTTSLDHKRHRLSIELLGKLLSTLGRDPILSLRDNMSKNLDTPAADGSVLFGVTLADTVQT